MTIEIRDEQECRGGWSFLVRLQQSGQSYEFAVRLSWADYDHWSHGADPPANVVRAVFVFLLDREPAEAILPRFDAAVVRRYFPEADRIIPGLIE